MDDNTKKRIKRWVRIGLGVIFSPIIVPFGLCVLLLLAFIMAIHSLFILGRMTFKIVFEGWDGYDGADRYWEDAWYGFRREYFS